MFVWFFCVLASVDYALIDAKNRYGISSCRFLIFRECCGTKYVGYQLCVCL